MAVSVTPPGGGGNAGNDVGKGGDGTNNLTTTSAKSNAESIKLIGGLVALGSGLLVLGLIAGGALAVDSDNAVKVATGAFGVIGTLVGAYFGQKIGSDGVKEAATRADQEATKAQIYAAHLPAAEAPQIVAMAHAAATGKPLQKAPSNPSVGVGG
jgi:hypothetical protein